jgi:hypothetical protein
MNFLHIAMTGDAKSKCVLRWDLMQPARNPFDMREKKVSAGSQIRKAKAMRKVRRKAV